MKFIPIINSLQSEQEENEYSEWIYPLNWLSIEFI